MSGPRTVSCADFGDAVSDLAVGGVAEPLRSELHAHAQSCATCASLFAEVVAMGDALLHLAPAVEPPVGFESRAVARMTDASSRTASAARPSWTRRAAIAAAVLVALTTGAVVGRWTTDGGAEVASGAIVTASGERVGTAELDRGDAPRIVLTMQGDADWDGEWTCQLLAPNGEWVDAGSWTADEVTGGVWAAGIPTRAADAQEMRILGATGRVIATATLTT